MVRAEGVLAKLQHSVQGALMWSLSKCLPRKEVTSLSSLGTAGLWDVSFPTRTLPVEFPLPSISRDTRVCSCIHPTKICRIALYLEPWKLLQRALLGKLSVPMRSSVESWPLLLVLDASQAALVTLCDRSHSIHLVSSTGIGLYSVSTGTISSCPEVYLTV